MPSDWIVTVGIAVAVVVAVVGTLLWIARKGYLTPDVSDRTPEEREQFADGADDRDFRIPLRRRAKALTGPAKVFAGAVVLLFGGVTVATYQVLKTGSPIHQYITSEVQYGMVAVLGVAGGALLQRRFDDMVGHLEVVYQDHGEDVVDRVPYLKTRVRTYGGSTIVPEVARSRLVGLFPRLRQVGEDRRLRSEGKPLDDLIQHEIPDHAAELPDGDGWVIPTHDEGDEVVAGVSSAADVRYASPHQLSYEQATTYKSRIQAMRVRLRTTESQLAELYQQITRLETKIENEEYHQREDFMSDAKQLIDMVARVVNDVDGDDDDGPASVLENGQEAEA